VLLESDRLVVIDDRQRPADEIVFDPARSASRLTVAYATAVERFASGIGAKGEPNSKLNMSDRPSHWSELSR
jgi:hypothetical protein